jgi:hypothetical protein
MILYSSLEVLGNTMKVRQRCAEARFNYHISTRIELKQCQGVPNAAVSMSTALENPAASSIFEFEEIPPGG